MLNVINGGAHAANSIDLQEFMVVPVGADTFAGAMQIAAEVYHALKSVLGERGLATGVGDEGGFAPDLESSEAAIEAILEAAERAGQRDRIAIALDPATSEVYSDGRYRFEGRDLSSAELPAFWRGNRRRVSRRSRSRTAAPRTTGTAWAALTRELGERVQLVGDDLFVTNPARLREGIERGVANSILVKVNQIGTLTETIEAVRLAQANGYTRGDVPSLRRDGGRDDRRSGRRARHRADQDGRAGAQRPRREVQPAAADRGAARLAGGLPRLGRLPRDAATLAS